jgi:hypothetical protein
VGVFETQTPDELAAALPDIAANVGTGWADALDKLAGLLVSDRFAA